MLSVAGARMPGARICGRGVPRSVTTCTDDVSVPGGGNHRAFPLPGTFAQKGPLTAMQIRLTVLAPRSGQTPARTCDVLVTAPAGTALAAVASQLAAAVSGPESSQSGGAVVLHAGRERLDGHRIALGEPPLVDGAVLSLQVPGDEEATDDPVPAQLHVVAGPDAGGVHLLHGGQIRIGRSADADVPPRRPGRLAAALRGHGRRRRPGLGRRPRLDERHLAGRSRGARAPGPPRPRRAAAARRVRPPPRPGLPSAAPDDRPGRRGAPAGDPRRDGPRRPPALRSGRPRPRHAPRPAPRSPPPSSPLPRPTAPPPRRPPGPRPAGTATRSPGRSGPAPGPGTHARGEQFADVPAPRRGIGAWARRFKGGERRPSRLRRRGSRVRPVRLRCRRRPGRGPRIGRERLRRRSPRLVRRLRRSGKRPLRVRAPRVPGLPRLPPSPRCRPRPRAPGPTRPPCC